jgi:hypothetical protein
MRHRSYSSFKKCAPRTPQSSRHTTTGQGAPSGTDGGLAPGRHAGDDDGGRRRRGYLEHAASLLGDAGHGNGRHLASNVHSTAPR